MTYTFEQLKEDVRKEAEAIRRNATADELSNLNFSQLRPEHINKCIYGQMTGDCNSKRGVALIHTCACRYIQDYDLAEIQRDGFDRIQQKVNGETVDDFIESRTNDICVSHYSAIEAYILLPEARNANLIAYLRGETDNLEL